MYDWLSQALENKAEVVTANRRLAKDLAEHHAAIQIGAGVKAWATPAIRSYQDWLLSRTEANDAIGNFPTRLNAQQSHVLWEECIARSLKSSDLHSAALVRQAQDAWRRVCEHQVPLDTLRDSARSLDQRVFASAARDYAARLDSENWMDDQGLASLLTGEVLACRARMPSKVTFAGFDRVSPSDRALREAMLGQGIEVFDVGTREADGCRSLASFENSDAELRAAGGWARTRLTDCPDQRLAIVVIQLEKDAERAVRLVREGLAPGWQTGGDSFEAAVNVSYGRRLAQFPAIAGALLALDWLNRDLSSGEVCRLLRSTSIGEHELSERAVAEIELRSLPVMSWSPNRLVGSLRYRSRAPAKLLGRIEKLGKRRERISNRRSPAQWAVVFDDCLRELNWPGVQRLGSAEFQLVNRWRELLNEFARLELVLPSISLGAALSKIRTLAADTVFQPQAAANGVQLMGPLEAAGMEFDALWVAGLSSTNWPPQGNPSPLISRQLQRSFEMPDFEPADTLAYATRVLRRLAGSGSEVMFSYPRMDGDAEQVASGLLRDLGVSGVVGPGDPGWYASQIADFAQPGVEPDDPVPPVDAQESISGGTATIQRQITDPFAAFAYGRLGVRPIPTLSYGLPANLRGRIIHAALADLYTDIGSQARLREMGQRDLETRIAHAADRAVARYQAIADPVVSQLLALERGRMGVLLRAVVDLDLSRPAFDIVGLETPVKLAANSVRLDLRADRIDRDSSGLVILDYKTGAARKFLGSQGDPDDFQLVAYASAIDGQVSGLALVNVDSRRVDIQGAGVELTPDLDWFESLDRWRARVDDALERLANGDIRTNCAMTARDRRQFGLLSRIEELIHRG